MYPGKTQGKTLFIITHRPATSSIAELVVMLDGSGKAVVKEVINGQSVFIGDENIENRNKKTDHQNMTNLGNYTLEVVDGTAWGLTANEGVYG